MEGHPPDRPEGQDVPRWTVFWRTGSPDNWRLNLLRATTVVDVRERMCLGRDNPLDEEIRVREVSDGVVRVFHTTVTDLLRWSPAAGIRLRTLRSSDWMDEIARDAATDRGTQAFMRVFAEACEEGLWSSGTMREALDYCLDMMRRPRRRWMSDRMEETGLPF